MNYYFIAYYIIGFILAIYVLVKSWQEIYVEDVKGAGLHKYFLLFIFLVFIASVWPFMLIKAYGSKI